MQHAEIFQMENTKEIIKDYGQLYFPKMDVPICSVLYALVQYDLAILQFKR